MQDRIPVNPGRVLITPEDGSAAFYATMARADNPTQEGTPLSKATFLKDATAALFGLGRDAVPDDVFGVLSRFQNGLGNEYVWAKYSSTQVPKIVESTTAEKVAMIRRVGVSTFTLQYADSVEMSGDSVVLVNPVTITGNVSEYAGTYASRTVGKYVVSAENGEVYKVLNAACEYYGDYTAQHGYLVSVEYETVFDLVGYVNSPGPNAYPINDGYTYTALGQLGNKVQVATGSYTGTGTYGSSNKNSLTFDFVPNVIFVQGSTNNTGGWIMPNAGYGSALYAINNCTIYHLNVSVSGTTVSWYRNNANNDHDQLNVSGDTYHYIAFS